MRKLISALIFPSLVIAAAAIAHYWFQWSDAVVGSIVVLIVVGHELDKITDKLDAIAESVEALKESPTAEEQSRHPKCPTCGGLNCAVCGKPLSEDYADCPTCGRHWRDDGICGQSWNEMALNRKS